MLSMQVLKWIIDRVGMKNSLLNNLFLCMLREERYEEILE